MAAPYVQYPVAYFRPLDLDKQSIEVPGTKRPGQTGASIPLMLDRRLPELCTLHTTAHYRNGTCLSPTLHATSKHQTPAQLHILWWI